MVPLLALLALALADWFGLAPRSDPADQPELPPGYASPLDQTTLDHAW